jgi:hypothetical protein
VYGCRLSVLLAGCGLYGIGAVNFLLVYLYLQI